MSEPDEVALMLSAAILRAGDREIEALTLEALAADSTGGAGEGLARAGRSEIRGGAFGIEIVGAALVPVLVEAVRGFWKAYSGEVVKKMGVAAADATAERVKRWFAETSSADRRSLCDGVADAIRRVGAARGLSQADIEALVAAAAPERLGGTLAGR